MFAISGRRGQTVAFVVAGLLLIGGIGVAVAWGGGDGGGGGADRERADGTSSPSDSGSGSAPAATTTTLPAADPVCSDGALGQRTYILCTAGDTPDQPLIVALHGRGASAAEMQTSTELDRVGAARGYAVVYPEGMERRWGDDTYTTPTRPAGDEDVVFLDQLVTALRDDPRIGDGPVGVVGFSNGASMALRYASQRPENVRAVAAVAGQLPRDATVRPTAAVSLLLIYGTADPIRSYDDGIAETPDRQPAMPSPTLSTPETVDIFVAAAGSGVTYDDPLESDPDPSDGTRLRTEVWTWTTSNTMVVHHSVLDGGHTWPSSRGVLPSEYGPVSRDLDASAEAIAFIAQSS